MSQEFENKPPVNPQSTSTESNTWAMILHLSLLSGIVIPFGGFIVPIAIWQIKKDQMPSIDAHGKVVANWILSSVIYGLISGLLALIVIGFLLLGVLAILGIVFPIIGGIKASNGELWPYPLSIRFFS